MNSEKIQKYIGYVIKTLFTMLALLMVLSVVHIETNKKSPEEIAKILEDTKELRRALVKKARYGNENLPKPWPAKMNSPYPDMAMFDQEGKEFTLSSLKGRIIVIEFIDISSPKSQAQSGAGLFGPYYASASSDIDKYTQTFSQVLRKNSASSAMLPNDNVVELKIIVYGENGDAGSRDDAQNWAKHFDLKKSDNVIVAVPKKDIRGNESASLIAGFQLIDKNMLLRVDSSGPSPKHSLAMTFVPLMSKLMNR